MSVNPIPVNTPDLSGKEAEYLKECVESGWISSEGPFVREFEEKFASKMGRKFGVSVTNGSAALDAAVAALELGEGDEVLCPSFTIVSCGLSIIRSGAKPVWVDSDPVTWNLSVADLKKKLSSKTKAILLVHTYGLPCEMDDILELGVPVIEDAAEAHGLHYKDCPCGSFGELSTFSFYPNKLVTTGEGGMVLTDDERLAERLRSLRNLCFQRERRFYHEEMGWNFRMTNLQAAVGLAQLERLDEFVERKKSMGLKYQEAFQGLKGVRLPLVETAYAKNHFWVYGMVLEDRPARDVMRALADEKIGTRPFFYPMHRQPIFSEWGGESLPVSEELGERGFYIPSGLGLSEQDQDRVIATVRKVLGG